MSNAIAIPQKMYVNACAFSKASYELNQKAFGPSRNIEDMDLGLPSVVCAALALELYFKTLYVLEKGMDFKVNGKHYSHDFHRLFQELDNTTRQQMDSAFKESIAHRNMSDIEQLERVSSMQVPRDLSGNLLVWKDVFVKIRYVHEPIGRDMPMVFFPEIERAVVDSIRLRKPEWGHSASYAWRKMS